MGALKYHDSVCTGTHLTWYINTIEQNWLSIQHHIKKKIIFEQNKHFILIFELND